MDKVSLADKMRMQMLREQGYAAKAIVAAYPPEKLEAEYGEENLPSS